MKPQDLADLTEREWAAQVADLARMLNWRRYHTFRSDRSAAGWPDEALVRERLILLELKRETGKLSDAQQDWIAALHAAHVEAYVVRPSDLADLALILTCRGNPYDAANLTSAAAARLHARTRTELPTTVPP